MDYSFLDNISDLEVRIKENLANYTTFKLNLTYNLVVIKSEKALITCIQNLNEKKLTYIIIGNGSNLVISDQFSGVILKLVLPFDKNAFENFQENYQVSASTPLSYLTKAAIKHGLKGWEVITGIPATLGGAIAMNAGTGLGEIKSIVRDFTVIKKSGEIITHVPNEKSFSYRKNNLLEDGDIIISATLIHSGHLASISATIKEYLAHRNQTQPLASNNCGCVFKNHSEDMRAGATIDKLGFKGISIKGLSVSKKHANFFENDGSATFAEFKQLVEIINNKVYENYGIKFELEVKVY
jgi:UDP-N-acetylmuramate dehydrogenase